MDLRIARGLHDLILGRAVATIGDVVADRVIEQHRILRHHPDRVMQADLGHVAQVLPVDQNRATVHVVKAEQQPPDGGLARPRRADDRHGLARRHLQADPFQDHAFGVIAKVHIAQLDLAALHIQNICARFIGNFGGLL